MSDDGNVYKLRAVEGTARQLPPVATTGFPPPVPAVVDTIAALLERAKQGEIRAVAYACAIADDPCVEVAGRRLALSTGWDISRFDTDRDRGVYMTLIAGCSVLAARMTSDGDE